MEFAHKNAPSDLKIMNKMNNKKNNDPRTTSKRNSTPLDEYKLMDIRKFLCCCDDMNEMNFIPFSLCSSHVHSWHRWVNRLMDHIH